METTEKFAVKVPEYSGETAATVLPDGTIIFVEFANDDHPSNPLKDQDGIGEIFSLSHRHINYKSGDDIREIMHDDPDAVALSYFEHGNSLWFVMGSNPAAGVEFDFDGVRFAGVWVPDDCVRESYTGQDGLTRRQWMRKQAESACETYTDWCNGEVYGYDIQRFKTRFDDEGEPFDQEDDYRRDSPIFEDSCWGFYGLEYARQSIIEALPSDCVVEK